LTRDKLAEILALHDDLVLVDYVTCGSGGYLDFHKLIPTFLYQEKLDAELRQLPLVPADELEDLSPARLLSSKQEIAAEPAGCFGEDD
ncbi:hypothetical protein ACC695_39135, partial [Rhizobium ruizarguesonis]